MAQAEVPLTGARMTALEALARTRHNEVLAEATEK